MLRLHHAPLACSLASRFALIEAGLEHEINFVRTTLGEQKSEAYLKINPRGKVPALETQYGILTESTAILPYIADLVPEKGLFPKAGSFERARGQSWLSFLSSTVQPSFGRLFHASEASDPEAVKAAAITEIASALTELDSYLEGRDYMLDEFSIVDLSLATYGLWRMAPDIAGKLPPFPNIDRVQQSVISRPAFAGVLPEEMKVRAEA